MIFIYLVLYDYSFHLCFIFLGNTIGVLQTVQFQKKIAEKMDLSVYNISKIDNLFSIKRYFNDPKNGVKKQKHTSLKIEIEWPTKKINGISSTVFCVHRAVIVSLNEWNFSFGSQLKTIFHR
jgi:hypothetical protein